MMIVKGFVLTHGIPDRKKSDKNLRVCYNAKSYPSTVDDE